VKRAMKRAGVVTPAKGAHVLRHTAATEMLRHGVPLDRIALVLKHRGVRENNDGAFGTFVFDVLGRTVTLEHNECYTEVNTTSHEF
jgi:hypothetical protein